MTRNMKATVATAGVVAFCFAYWGLLMLLEWMWGDKAVLTVFFAAVLIGIWGFIRSRIK